MPFYAASKKRKYIQIRCNRFLFQYFVNVNLLHLVQDTNGAQWKFMVNIHLAPKYASFLCYFYIHEYVVHNLKQISKISPGTSRLERDNSIRNRLSHATYNKTKNNCLVPCTFRHINNTLIHQGTKRTNEIYLAVWYLMLKKNLC